MMEARALSLWRLAFRLNPKRLPLALIAAWANGFSGVLLMAALALVLIRPSVWLVAAIGLLLGLRALLHDITERQGALAGAVVRVQVRYLLSQQLFSLGPVGIGRLDPGATSTLLLEQADSLDGYVARFLPALHAGLFIPFIILITLSALDPVSTLILLGCALALPVVMAVSGVLAKGASARQLGALTRLAGLFHDRLQNLMLLRALNATARTETTLAAAADEFRQRTMKVLRIAFLSSAGFEVAAVAGLVLVALHVALQAQQGMSLGAALFILLLVPEFFAPLRALLNTYHDRLNAVVAMNEINRFLAIPPMMTSGLARVPDHFSRPSLEFKGVTFAYTANRAPALRNLGFTVKAGEWVGLTGASGTGKSTILHLLLGFITPASGEILVGDYNLLGMDLAARRELFSFIGQRSHLFHGTLRENIRLARATATDAELLAAVHAAQLDALVERLPDGLDTLIGERGFGLSGGEAQRVALARAFLQQAPVLLLDEPTAGLDRDTADALLASLRLMAQNRTVLMVSHDPVALQAAGRTMELLPVDEAAA